METSFDITPVEGASSPRVMLDCWVGRSSVPISAPSAANLGSQSQDKAYYECHRCGKRYTRQDHIKRHFHSREHFLRPLAPNLMPCFVLHDQRSQTLGMSHLTDAR